MQVGAVYVVYEDSGFLRESYLRIYPLVDLIVFLVGENPWEEIGDPQYPHQTLETIFGLPDPQDKNRIVRQHWKTEHEQRNYGNEFLHKLGCPWCLIIDDDELYNPEELKRAISCLPHQGVSLLGVQWQIYWKNRSTVIQSLTGPMPTFIRTDPQVARFTQNRMVSVSRGEIRNFQPQTLICHHLSYVRTDDQMQRKLSRLAQCERAQNHWYENIWLKWTPDMKNLHPVNPESFTQAIPAQDSRWKLDPINSADISESRHMLSLAMIVKDEQDHLGACLESVSGVFDEIVIVDTGSTDNTVSIAHSHKAIVYSYTWNDSFADARNYSFSRATGHYVMWLDADDILKPEDRELLLLLKSQLQPDSKLPDAYLMLYDYAQDSYGKSTCQFYRHRIIRNNGEIRWNYPIHECLGITPTSKEAMTNIVVTHRKADDFDTGRNLRLLRRAVAAQPDDQRLKFYLAKELFYHEEIKESESLFEEYLQRSDWHDNRINARFLLAVAQHRLGKGDMAIDTALEGIKADPRWAEFYCLIGHVYYDKQDWFKAIPWYELARTRSIPSTVGTVLTENYTWIPCDRLCKCYSEIGHLQQAYDANERMLAYRPEESRALFNREVLRDRLFPGRTLGQPIRLNLGSGAKPVSSYRNCDLHLIEGVLEVFDQGAVPYRDSSVQAIYSEHALEHAPNHRAALDTIKEWSRVLKYGGTLHLKVPDLDQCCLYFANSPDVAREKEGVHTQKEWYRHTIYGIQKSNDGEPDTAQHHNTGFTRNELVRVLTSSGFSVDQIATYDGWGTPSLEVRAIQEKKTIRVKFLVGSLHPDFPTRRIRTLNLHSWLNAHGFNSQVIPDYTNDRELPNLLSDADIVVFTHVGPFEEELSNTLRDRGVGVIYDWAENVDWECRDSCFQAAHLMVGCSTLLAKKFNDLTSTLMIPDAYEVGKNQDKHHYLPHGDNRKIRVTWCGMGGNQVALQFLPKLIESLHMEFVTIHEHEGATIPWNRETWIDDLEDTDIIIVPQLWSIHPAKSNNRLTQAMSLGIPVIASPLNAYTEIIKDGENGFLCSIEEGWSAVLTLLRDDQTLRERIGKAGQVTAESFSLDKIGSFWGDTLTTLCKQVNNPPPVDIIIPTFNNLKYLITCVQSIRSCTAYPHHIIVVNSGSDGTADWARNQADLTLIQSPERLHFSAAINRGIEAGSSPYVCLLNDDTIVSRGWLNSLMHEAIKEGVGAVGPFSNCDQGWTHHEEISLKRGEETCTLGVGMTLDQVSSWIPQIQTYTHKKEVHSRKWVAFYATVLPRSVIGRVGPLDTDFKDGCEDFDYCRRINLAGYHCVDTYDSWVFHFGSCTRKNTETVDYETYHREDQENHRLMQDKASQGELTAVSSPKIVAIYTGPGWEPWGPESHLKGGIGGSETAAIHVSQEFSNRGWRSLVFGEYDVGAYKLGYTGVEYYHHSKFESFAQDYRFDLLISSRTLVPCRVQADIYFCWVHDIWISPEPKSLCESGDQVDRFLVLSEWHRDFFAAHHQIDPARLHLIWNGVDHTLFTENLTRHRGRLIYSSSFDRGLDNLLRLWPRLCREAGARELHVYYGSENWERALRARPNPTQERQLNQIKDALHQPGITYLGRVGQQELARAFLQADLWAYPTHFTETFCITAAEAMTAGVPVLTTALAGLTTTVGEAGILIPGSPRDRAYQDEFILQASRLLGDRRFHDRMAARGKEKAALYTWAGMVDDLLQLVDSLKKEPCHDL